MSKKEKKLKLKEEFGSASFHCKNCQCDFEVSWIEIFDIQEMTHGFVEFEIHEEYIACPKCGENKNEEKDDVSGYLPF